VAESACHAATASVGYEEMEVSNANLHWFTEDAALVRSVQSTMSVILFAQAEALSATLVRATASHPAGAAQFG